MRQSSYCVAVDISASSYTWQTMYKTEYKTADRNSKVNMTKAVFKAELHFVYLLINNKKPYNLLQAAYSDIQRYTSNLQLSKYPSNEH